MTLEQLQDISEAIAREAESVRYLRDWRHHESGCYCRVCIPPYGPREIAADMQTKAAGWREAFANARLHRDREFYAAACRGELRTARQLREKSRLRLPR